MASCVHNIRFKVNKVVPLSEGAFCFKYKKRLKKFGTLDYFFYLCNQITKYI